MGQLTLVMGDRNKSSWSLRPYLALVHAGAQFEEVTVRLDRRDTAEQIRKWSPSGTVPLLRDGELAIWESLAICEYVAELFPKAGLWPEDRAQRAVARAVSSEMHAGFSALRNELTMKISARYSWKEISPAAQRDVERVKEIWRECRKASGGPFLFGSFTIADAMYAPVVTRFVTYDVPVDAQTQGYMDAILALPAMQKWTAEAYREVASQL